MTPELMALKLRVQYWLTMAAHWSDYPERLEDFHDAMNLAHTYIDEFDRALARLKSEHAAEAVPYALGGQRAP